MRTIIHFSSRFTVLPFLYLQALYHLCTIIYLWDILAQKSRYFAHSKLEPYNPKRTLYACVQRICSTFHLPKQTKMTNIFQTEHHNYQITHELFTRTCFRLRVKQVCANVSFSKEVYHKEASHFYLIYKYPTSRK